MFIVTSSVMTVGGDGKLTVKGGTGNVILEIIG